MNILQAIKKLRDDLKAWATLNFTHLNKKIDDNRVYADSRRFSGDYNDLKNAPPITSESDKDLTVMDEAGNIIFKADENGIHTTSLTLHGQDVEDIIEGSVAALVDGAPDMLATLDSLASALGEDPNFATTMAIELGKKIDKVEGKGLSTNDFTDEYKNKIDFPDLLEQDPTVPSWAKNPVKPNYTKSEIGLENVDNTSDLDKPISNATNEKFTKVDETITNLHQIIDAEVAVMQEKINQSEQTIRTEISNGTFSSENDNFVIADEQSNIIMQVNAGGVHTTNIESSGISSENDKYSIVDSFGNIIATFDYDGLETTKLTVQSLVINGKELKVDGGSGLPEVAITDNGKILQVINGSWELVNPIAVLG